jgi:MSHA biogenesis protein MshL
MPSYLVRKSNGFFIYKTKKITASLFLGILVLSACISNNTAYKENENPQTAAEPFPSVNINNSEESGPNEDWDEDLETPKDARALKKSDNKRKKIRSPLRSLVETQQSFLYPETDLSDELEPASRKTKSNKNSFSEDDPLEILLTQSDTETKRLMDQGPKFSISAKDVDIKTILFSISKEIDKNILIDPSIRQKASVDLKDVPLREVLEALLIPLKLKYTIEKNYIRVTANKMETRIFHLNYIISRRQGSSNLQSSSGSQISGAGISGGTSISGNARITSSLVSTEETDLWNEISTGLRQFLSPGANIDGIGDSTDRGATSPLSAALGSLGGGAATPAAPAGDDAEEGDDGAANKTENGFVSINKQAGLIIVKDFPEQLLKVAKYLEAVEGSTQRQVYIQAQILEVNLNDEYRFGIDWSTVTPIDIINDGLATNPATSLLQGTSNLTYGISNAKLNLVVEALQNQGSVSVLSSPKIPTLNNQRAVIKVGTENIFFVPEVTPATTTTASSTTFQPATVTVGIILDVLPQININGQVMMSINTSISERTGTAISPDGINRVPILNVREANNVVLSQNGQTIIIGGLMQDRKTTGTKGVPFLEDIPIFGRLFQRELETNEKTELVILLTPEVLGGQKIDGQVIAESMDAKRMGAKFN